MENCRDVLEHLSEYLDEELPPSELSRMAEHLSQCTDCGDARDRLLRSIQLCREFRSDEKPGELPREVRDELHAAYRAFLSMTASGKSK